MRGKKPKSTISNKKPTPQSEDIPVEDQPFSRQEFDVSRDDSRRKSRRRYLLASAVGGQALHHAFFATAQAYCKHRQAQLVILPMRGVSKTNQMYPRELQQFANHFVSDYVLNSNLKALDLMLYPQQQQPLLGLDRLGQKDRSLIVAHPKQHMRTTPVSNLATPHLLLSTGAITVADNYARTRAGMLAEQDHVVGGLIVEVEDNVLFHVRQIQADESGGFNDLETYYVENTRKPAVVEALVIGDYHVGSEDPMAVLAWQELAALVKPRRIAFHDFADQLSTNHHLEHNVVARLSRPEKFRSIETEIEAVQSTLELWRRKFPKPEFLMVASNHNEFLDRHILALKHFKEDHNLRIGNRMLEAMFSGHSNPIEWFLKERGFKDEKTTWLRRDQDYKVCGIQLASHGDKGPNGSRGGVQSLRNIGPAICGHFHSPQILSPLWVVGTTTRLNLDYTKGHASSWLHSSCLLYANGQRSMINAIQGAFRMQ